jgi:hypothetical protein
LRKSLPAVLAAVIASMLLAACTSTSKSTSKKDATPASHSSSAKPAPNATISPNDLAARLTAAMDAVTNVHVKGSLTERGGSIAMDVRLASHKGAGWIVQGRDPKIDMIIPGGAWVYFRAPTAFWREKGNATAAAMFGGKWVKVPSNDKDFAELKNTFFDSKALLSNITKPMSGANDFTHAGTATVNGVDAVVYKESDGSQLFIAASGPPRILKLVSTGSDSGTLTFDYRGSYAFTAPSPSVDLPR